MQSPSADLRARLEHVAAHERTLRKNVITSFLHGVGPTRAFAFVYSRIGPYIDRYLLHRRGAQASQFYGFPALLLITTGAKSGLPRESPLLYVRDGEAFAIVGTNFGGKPHPAWTGNLQKTPAARIVVADQSFDVQAELADDDTWQRLWPKFCEMYPGYDAYLKRLTERTPRMFLLRPQA
jgi:deazaflavin-dependent oxidoreductase (nitroreductase family)